MAAVPYVTFDDVVENMVYQCSLATVFDSLIPVLQAWRVANAVPLAVEMSTLNKNRMLGIVTGLTVATGTDLNAYPRGYDTAFYFDLDGNPVTP